MGRITLADAVDVIGRTVMQGAPEGVEVMVLFIEGEEVALASNMSPLKMVKELRSPIEKLEE